MNSRPVLFSFLFILFSACSYAQSPQYDINGPLIADGGICSLQDTASFSCALTTMYNQNLNYYVDFDFGDGGTETFSFHTNSLISAYIFTGRHQYTANGTYLVKAYVKDAGNVVHDSVQLNVTIGNCQKASGKFYFDFLQNCTQDPLELGVSDQYYTFLNNGIGKTVYLDTLGRFSIPVYPGDSYLPQTGWLSYLNAYVGGDTCGGLTAITGAMTNYNVPVVPPASMTHTLNLFEVYDTMVCAGQSADFYWQVNASDNWYVRFDFGDGHIYDPNQFYTGEEDMTHIYTDTGLFRARIMLYNQNHYGPLMAGEKMISVAQCHPVKITAFSDENNDCVKTAGEFKYNIADNASSYGMYSMARNGNNPYSQNSDGTITTYIWPGDTVYKDPQFDYVHSYGPGWANSFDDIAVAENCAPPYLTEALDSVDLAYKGEIDVATLGYSENAGGNRCKGDTFLFALHVNTVGIPSGTGFRLIAAYSDGAIDSFSLAPVVNDTFTFNFSKTIGIASNSFSGTFIVEREDGSYADTLFQSFQLYNCGVVKMKAFYDVNRNCIKDTGEIYLQNYVAYSLNNPYPVSLDSETLRFSSFSSNDPLQEVILGATSQLGRGYYSRLFTPGCIWPVFQRDTGYYEVALIDSVNVVGAGLVNGYNVFPEVTNIPLCDSVFRPTLKGQLRGNRNEQNQFYFAYFDGLGGAPDTVNFLSPDPFTTSLAPYYTQAPNNVYSYGTYLPGYWLIKGQNDSVILKYTHNANLLVSRSCEVPKARLFTDLNSNCSKQTNEPALTGVTVVVTVNSGPPFNLITDAAGNVYFNAANGSNVTITVPQQVTNGQSLITTCMTSNTLTYTYNSAGYATYSVPYQCASGPVDYSIIAGHNFWTPGSTDTIYIYPQYIGCTSGAAALSLTLDPALNFIASSLAGQQQNGQVLSWNVANVGTLGIAPVKVAVALNTVPPAGTYLCNTATLTPAQPDLNVSNNTFILCDTVYGTVPDLLKTGLTDSIYLQTGQPVVYTIHFKNTSTTPVQVVTVLDSISPLLDINSLQVLSASAYHTTIPLPGNVLKFTFPGIPGALAPGATGMIRFSLLPLGTVTPGTVIYNKADVLFNHQGFFTSNMINNFRPSMPLPIELSRIGARNQGSVNYVDWQTGREALGDYFELERSKDGKSFTLLATILAKGLPAKYQHIDAAPFTGVNYYRIRLSGIDHKATYSKTVTATVSLTQDFRVAVYPNPVTQYVTLKIEGNQGGSPEIAICDITGRRLSVIKPSTKEMTIDMSHFAPGVYLIKYSDRLHTQTINLTKE